MVRNGAIVGVALLIGIMGLIMVPSGNKSVPASARNQPPIKADMLLPRAQDRTVEQLSGGLTAQEGEIGRLRREIEQQKASQDRMLKRIDDVIRGMDQRTTPEGVNAELLAEVQKLRDRVEQAEARRELDGPINANAIATQPPPAMGGGAKEEIVPPPVIKIIGEETQPETAKKEPDAPIPYVVANSMFEGELLNGMDAPTDQTTKKNPVPAVLRIKSEAILPNMVNIGEVQECFLSVAGYGDMADERAKMRTETLSCVLASEDIDKPPRIVEAKVDGYVVGEDGRVGLRGRLVSKQGQLIARTLFAGVLSGIGDGLEPRQVQGLDLNPSGTAQTQTFDGATIAASGLAQGVSDTAKSISDYYLKLADQMMPVIEIDAARKVTVVLLKGVELK